MTILFGATAQKLSSQLHISQRCVQHLQRDADAITRLLVRGYLSEAQGQRARHKIVRQIARLMRETPR